MISNVHYEPILASLIYTYLCVVFLTLLFLFPLFLRPRMCGDLYLQIRMLIITIFYPNNIGTATAPPAEKNPILNFIHKSEDIGPQFRLLEKNIVRTETNMVRFDWLLCTFIYWKVNKI